MKPKRFYLNGVGPFGLNEIARDVVVDFANKHPMLDAQQVRDIIVIVCKNVKIPHIVETEAEYHNRNYQSSQERTVMEITIPNGEKLYVSNQWRAGKPTDNFYTFRDIVNSIGWGKIV